MPDSLPILYSFRRCPYAMRARLALASAKIAVEHREVSLRDKPDAMLKASPKATVPILVTNTQTFEQSLDIMLWALDQNDPENWLDIPSEGHALIAETEDHFKPALDHYKYSSRHPDRDRKSDRAIAARFLQILNSMLTDQPYLYGDAPRLPDMAIAPFVRQFAHVDLAWFTAQPWPELANWLNRFKASERFTNIMVKYPLWVPDSAPNAV